MPKTTSSITSKGSPSSAVPHQLDGHIPGEQRVATACPQHLAQATSAHSRYQRVGPDSPTQPLTIRVGTTVRRSRLIRLQHLLPVTGPVYRSGRRWPRAAIRTAAQLVVNGAGFARNPSAATGANHVPRAGCAVFMRSGLVRRYWQEQALPAQKIRLLPDLAWNGTYVEVLIPPLIQVGKPRYGRADCLLARSRFAPKDENFGPDRAVLGGQK